ncbi:inner centromere protein [Aspergillus unguis]
MYGNPAAPQPGSSIFKTAQPQRPGHPMDMAKYASGKIPFAEASHAGPSQPHRTPGASSSKAPKPSPNYPNGENINLPEIATDSEDEDSEAEMLPVPNWAQPKELEMLLRDQEGMEVDNIFGPIAPFSLEETFKADKRVKKFRERTSSANWAGPDGLTQEEIRRDISERQRLRLNGGWTFGM